MDFERMYETVKELQRLLGDRLRRVELPGDDSSTVQFDPHDGGFTVRVKPGE
jgi:hypothetical protein